ncbi:MAG: hypothetical protein ACXV3V_11570, partial [Actinomycetes bacterium]
MGVLPAAADTTPDPSPTSTATADVAAPRTSTGTESPSPASGSAASGGGQSDPGPTSESAAGTAAADDPGATSGASDAGSPAPTDGSTNTSPGGTSAVTGPTANLTDPATTAGSDAKTQPLVVATVTPTDGAAAAGDTAKQPEVPGGQTTDPGALSATSVRSVISAYVASVVRSSVVDLQGRPASCFCAVSISVSFDGPTNAVAVPGRVAVPTDAGAAQVGGASATSGRSGDSTAVSVTGGGSAAASATSGSTGAVVPEGSSTASTLTTAAAPRQRTTRVDVSHLADALQSMVDGLAGQMARASGASTGAQASDLLSALPSAAGGRADVDIAAWDGRSVESAGRSPLRCSPYDDGSHVPSCALAVAVSAGSGAHATVLPMTAAAGQAPAGGAAAGTAADSLSPGMPGMATAISVAVSGAAVSSARTGDQGGRAPHGAVLDTSGPLPSTLGSKAASRSGSSGDSMAVALTVRGAASTSSRSGDSGSALSAVGGA